MVRLAPGSAETTTRRSEPARKADSVSPGSVFLPTPCWSGLPREQKAALQRRAAWRFRRSTMTRRGAVTCVARFGFYGEGLRREDLRAETLSLNHVISLLRPSRHRETGVTSRDRQHRIDGCRAMKGLRALVGVPLSGHRSSGSRRLSLPETRAIEVAWSTSTKPSPLAAPKCSPAGPSRKGSFRETWVKRNKGSSTRNRWTPAGLRALDPSRRPPQTPSHHHAPPRSQLC